MIINYLYAVQICGQKVAKADTQTNAYKNNTQ
jgi:hypothetical protein